MLRCAAPNAAAGSQWHVPACKRRAVFPAPLSSMSDFELGKLRALGDNTPPGERTPELEALVGFATTMGHAETLIKAAAARRKQQGSEAEAEQLEPDVFEASGLTGARGWTLVLMESTAPPSTLDMTAAAAAAVLSPPPPFSLT